MLSYLLAPVRLIEPTLGVDIVVEWLDLTDVLDEDLDHTHHSKLKVVLNEDCSRPELCSLAEPTQQCDENPDVGGREVRNGAAGLDDLRVGETRLLTLLLEVIANLFDGDATFGARDDAPVRVIIGGRYRHDLLWTTR